MMSTTFIKGLMVFSVFSSSSNLPEMVLLAFGKIPITKMRVVIFTILAFYSSTILSTLDEPDLHSFKHLVKRPVWPLTCQCSRDYGYPNYDTCRSAIAQLPTWTSWAPIPDANAPCMLNLDFQENTRRMFRFRSVRLPIRRSFGWSLHSRFCAR